MRAVLLLCSCTALALAGCTGPTGPQGEKGDKGAAGADGAAGATGATGAAGENGQNGVDAPTTGVLSGTVSDAVLTTALPNVDVKLLDTGGATVLSAVSSDTGAYTLNAVPFGVYKLEFTRASFTAVSQMVGVIPGQTVTVNASLAEAASGKPSVTLAINGDDFGYGNTATVTANATDAQGDTLTYVWKNGTVPVLGTVTGTGNTGTVTMPTMQDAFATRQNPTNPGEYITGCKIPDRFGILPITPDCRAQVSAQVVVSDGRGQSTTASITLNATSVIGGIRTVPVNARLYLNSGKATGSNWALTAKPTGSTATLSDMALRTPSFIPDKKGTYTLTEGTNTINIEAGDWVGVVTGFADGQVESDSMCLTCHNGSIAADKFTPWEKTGHANIFAAGINGGSGTSGVGCLDCHTVGYDKGVANNGFDDIAKTLNWTWPTTLVATNFNDLLTSKPTLARMAGIQCESCHGPQNAGTHTLTQVGNVNKPFNSPRISFSAELCGTCHGRTSHHLYSEWATVRADGMGHSNFAGARDTGARGGTLNNSCGRCHAAQGFVKYVKQVAAGKPGNLPTTDTDGFALADVTWANVEPVTCTACHDPHDNTNPNQLRVYGNSGLLPSGFAVTGFGKGALCVSCHNSRNGLQTGSSTLTWLHEDNESYNLGNPTGYSAPHQAAQGDVFAGRNAYFMGNSLPMLSKHAAIEDTCVGCHMAGNPAMRLSHGEPTNQSHIFRINAGDTAKVCAECHSEGVNGEGIQAGIETGLEELAHEMGLAVEEKINTFPGGLINVIAYDGDPASPTFDKYSSSTQLVQIDVTQNPVTHVGIVEGHGQIEFHLTFTNPVTIQFVNSNGTPAGSPVAKTEFGVQMGSLRDNQATPVAIYGLNGNMVRAGWNYFLIHGDATKGLHNPSFSQQVLNNTLAQDLSY